MDERYRSLERRALGGDIESRSQLRQLALSIGLLSKPVIRALAGYGYQPAKDVLRRHEIPPSTSNAFDILYHDIPHNAHTAAVVRHRVIYAAARRVAALPEVIDTLEDLDTATWDFQLRGTPPPAVLSQAIELLDRLTQEDYYDALCIKSRESLHGSQNSRWINTSDPIVRQHEQASKNCQAVSALITEQQPDDPTIPAHLSRVFAGLGGAIGLKLAGFEGTSELRDNLYSLQYFLDRMDYTWNKQAHIEAIFSVYLI